MKSHELARRLLSMPDLDVVASVDIATGILDKHGDEIIDKIFGTSICEVFEDRTESILHFELSSKDK